MLTIKDNILLKIVQDADKSFETLVIPKSLALTVLVNSHNLWGHAGTNKTYSLIKRDFYWQEMCKGIDKFIQHCHIYKQHNLQKQSYSCIHIKLPKRSFGFIALDLIGSFHPSSKENTYVLTCMCLLTNYPIRIPIPDKTAEQLSKLTYNTFMPPWWIPYLNNIWWERLQEWTLSGSCTQIWNQTSVWRPHHAQSNDILEIFHILQKFHSFKSLC